MEKSHKTILVTAGITALVSLIVIAVVFRVPQVKTAVTGA